jgi:predicted ATP-grasp superfamily ATP-dependent carboligase
MKFYFVRNLDSLKNFDILQSIVDQRRFPQIKCVRRDTEIDLQEDFRIIPKEINDMRQYLGDKTFKLFCQGRDNTELLHNKSRFAEFMMKNFPDTAPECYYYSYDRVKYISPPKTSTLMIQKPSSGHGGRNINIITEFDVSTLNENIVITKYHPHNTYYTSHFLVKNGSILKEVHFSSMNDEPHFIKRGSIQNYSIHFDLKDVTNDNNPDGNIFSRIFATLEYCGFACIDFTIEDGRVIIFEINPRIGGSLVRNTAILNEFLQVLVSEFSH